MGERYAIAYRGGWGERYANIVLSKAVLSGGTTIKDYKQPNGKVGSFKQKLKVYGREKLKCYNCNSFIIKLSINN